MLKLVCAASLFAGLALCQNADVTVTVDAAANRHAIQSSADSAVTGVVTFTWKDNS